MKRLYYIVACLLSWMIVLPAEAQEENTTTQTTQQQRKSPRASRGERAEKKEDNGLPELTLRAQELNERMTQQIGNARWMRVIYRQVDLMKEQNAPLYYPVRPMNGQMNLFTIIFQLLSEGKLQVYEYLDGYEVFDDAHLVNFKELLDRFHVYYEEVPGKRGEEPALVINESDVPSEQVRSYYVKEAWYFDQNNSLFDVKILAICPLLTIDSDFGLTTSPMFWLPYENIRPYVTNSYIMTSNLNNAALFTTAEEKTLIKTLSQLPEVIRISARDYDPSHVNRYLITLAGDFHRFYNACRIKGEEAAVLSARLKLADTVRSVIANCLALIGVTAPEKM